VDELSFEAGFLRPVESLTLAQIEAGCETAHRNATDLLEEADILRVKERCARAYFLAHIACEEMGKLPILTTLAVSLQLGHEVNWRRIDQTLRSHTGKIAQVLFMDSIVGGKGLREGSAEYQADLQRMRMYTDMKNASLYSFSVEGDFAIPNEQVTCEFFDGFRNLASGRLGAFEAMFLRPFRERGGLENFLSGPLFERAHEFAEIAGGPEGQAAYDEFARTGDESTLHRLFDRALQAVLDGESEAEPQT
jgi:AbiV family abortive infection protein